MNGLGYDPSDMHSFPYGIDATSLQLEPGTIEVAGDIDPIEIVSCFLNYDDDDTRSFRMLDMACRLFAKMMTTTDHAFDGIPAANLFAACCHTAGIWENG